MAENKTQPNDRDVDAFVDNIADVRRRADARVLLAMMARVTGLEPVMWGDSIVGFGRYHYRYESAREGDFLLTGFSPRKAAMTVYIMPGFKRYTELLTRLGPHRHSVSCLYVRRLDKINLKVLEEIIHDSVARMKEIYPDGSSN